jgi:hypothetical protein
MDPSLQTSSLQTASLRQQASACPTACDDGETSIIEARDALNSPANGNVALHADVRCLMCV